MSNHDRGLQPPRERTFKRSHYSQFHKRPPSAARLACGSHKPRLCSNLGFRFVKRRNLLLIRAGNRISTSNLPKPPMGWRGAPGVPPERIEPCTQPVVTSCPADSPASRPPSGAPPSVTSTAAAFRLRPKARQPSIASRYPQLSTRTESPTPSIASFRVLPTAASVRAAHPFSFMGSKSPSTTQRLALPAPTAPTSQPLLDELFLSADASDEAVSMINALAEKLGLDAKTAPPSAAGPKRTTQ